jgi:hypothetical protein
VRIEGEVIKPVADAFPDGVSRRRADVRVDLLVQFLEPVLNLGLGLAPYRAPPTLPLAVEAK